MSVSQGEKNINASKRCKCE